MSIFKDILESIKQGQFAGEVLDLNSEACNQKLTDKDVEELAFVLRTHPEIKMINLSYNSITDKGVEALATLTALEVLDFSNILSGHDEAPNLITAIGATALATMNLKMLILHANLIGDAGLAALGLSETLLELDVSDCGLTGTGVSKFFSCNTHVQSLNLSGNKLHSECLNKLAMSSVIQVLNLSGCCIDAAGAEWLSRNNSLLELELSNNEIGMIGAQALACHPRLETLNLSECKLDDHAVSGFATNMTLTSLWLSHNRITVQGLEILCKNQTLKMLSLSGNAIRFDSNLLERLAHMPSLTHIYARDNRFNTGLSRESFEKYFYGEGDTLIEVADFQTDCPSTKKKMLFFYNKNAHRTRLASTLEEPEESSSGLLKKAKP